MRTHSFTLRGDSRTRISSPLRLIPLLLLAAAAVGQHAGAASEGLIYPDGRQVLEVRPNERNPFAQQIVQDTQPAAGTQEGVSEEARLRRILRTVKIGGVSAVGGNRRALLGSLILKPGDTLPPLVSNQAEMLRVASIEEGSIILEFIERDPAADSRKIILTYAMKPEVNQFLFGEAVEGLAQIGPKGKTEMPLLSSPGVTEILKGTQDAELKNIADRDEKLMGVVHDDQNAKKPQ